MNELTPEQEMALAAIAAKIAEAKALFTECAAIADERGVAFRVRIDRVHNEYIGKGAVQNEDGEYPGEVCRSGYGPTKGWQQSMC